MTRLYSGDPSHCLHFICILLIYLLLMVMVMSSHSSTGTSSPGATHTLSPPRHPPSFFLCFPIRLLLLHQAPPWRLPPASPLPGNPLRLHLIFFYFLLILRDALLLLHLLLHAGVIITHSTLTLCTAPNHCFSAAPQGVG
jgi:hypothetical protein